MWDIKTASKDLDETSNLQIHLAL